jgi:hypothetical protein
MRVSRQAILKPIYRIVRLRTNRYPPVPSQVIGTSHDPPLPVMTPVALHKQLSRTQEALRSSLNAISEQERLVQVLRANGSSTERAEELLDCFKQAHAVLTYYQQELKLRIKEQPGVAGTQTDGGLQVTYL